VGLHCTIDIEAIKPLRCSEDKHISEAKGAELPIASGAADLQDELDETLPKPLKRASGGRATQVVPMRRVSAFFHI
jgi:hypothetical protein